MLNLPAQMRDEKDERMMRDEKMNVVETLGTEKLCPRQRCQKCCRTDCHDNAQTGGCHSDPRSLRLSLSPAAKGGRPCKEMDDQL